MHVSRSPLHWAGSASTYTQYVSHHNWQIQSKWLSIALFSFPGIRRAPEIRNIVPSPDRVVLTVLTAEAGIDSSSPFFAFDVKVSNGVSTNCTFQFDGYLDNTEEELIINDLEAGRYLFSVRSRNDFGASDFIGTEDLTTVEGDLVALPYVSFKRLTKPSCTFTCT